jgi:hypothetical protein
MDKKPWEVHSSLTAYRLCHLAYVMKDVRHKALELYDPAEGDGVWSLGCRIYERTINTIERESEKYPWLDVIRDGLYFVILIDGVPIRFYKGDAETPKSKSLRVHYAELEAQQEVFDFDNSQWFWRLVVETDISGEVLRIVMGQFTEQKNLRNIWEVPISETIPSVTTAASTYQEGIVLDKPTVTIRKDKQQRGAINE